MKSATSDRFFDPAAGELFLKFGGRILEPSQQEGFRVDPEDALAVGPRDLDPIARLLVNVRRREQPDLRRLVEEGLERIVGHHENRLQRQPGEILRGAPGHRIGEDAAGEERLDPHCGGGGYFQHLVGNPRNVRPKLRPVGNGHALIGVHPDLVWPDHGQQHVVFLVNRLFTQLAGHADLAGVGVASSGFVGLGHRLENALGRGVLGDCPVGRGGC